MGVARAVGRLSAQHTFTLGKKTSTAVRRPPLAAFRFRRKLRTRGFRGGASGSGAGRIAAGEGRGEEPPGLQSESKAGQGAGRCLTAL